MSFKFSGIDHVQLAAPENCEAAARKFFGHLLGWKEISKPEKLQHRGGVWFQCGTQQVHIGVQADFVPATKAHPGFYVDNLDDLRAFLINNHITLIEDDLRAEENISRFYVNDPFGNRLEFLELTEINSTERFTERVDTYVLYRPSYPEKAIDFLYNSIGLNKNCVIADIGAGTGIFTKLLLARGSKVIAIEPNQAMRESAKQQLVDYPNVQFEAGTAERSGLPDQCVDFIVCAQAFHWFDRSSTQQEFKRILKPGGKVILIWNTRRTSGTRFLEDYDKLLHTYGTDYLKVKHTNITTDTLASFFKVGSLQEQQFTLSQQFDFDGLRGRLLSSSYCPMEGHPNYEPMIDELKQIFEQYNKKGHILFEYVTQVFWGEL